VALVRYDARHFAEVRRAELLVANEIDVVLDVGANDGTYALSLRSGGYAGRIVSFEPQSEAYAELAEAASRDARWECRRLALGDRLGEAVLNLSSNSSSSSLLSMNVRHEEVAPESAYVGSEVVSIATLDELRDELLAPDDRVMLKIDVQGLELDALRGAGSTLEQVLLVETELSLVPLYDDAPLLPEVLSYLQLRGFSLLGLAPVLLDPRSGAVLQLDGSFGRVG
jgi:FkbM family methyltransferase